MPFITAENAAELARKSHEAKRAKAERVQAEVNEALKQQVATDSTDFISQRLSRVRAQLVRLDALASQEDDPKRIREYADATSRLQEQERQLAGRPLPGTLKPSSKPQTRAPAVPQPTISGVPPTPAEQ